MKEILPDDIELANVFRTLGHPVRMSILRILANQGRENCCCTDVTECLPLAQSTVSQHIKVLLEAGLVERRAEGTGNCYTVSIERFTAMSAAYLEYVSNLSCCAATIGNAQESI
jgi:ArsR family transcriptional regulator, arsenate/arsenite/antimonite-responsive transcriptional repressor